MINPLHCIEQERRQARIAAKVALSVAFVAAIYTPPQYAGYAAVFTNFIWLWKL